MAADIIGKRVGARSWIANKLKKRHTQENRLYLRPDLLLCSGGALSITYYIHCRLSYQSASTSSVGSFSIYSKLSSTIYIRDRHYHQQKQQHGNWNWRSLDGWPEYSAQVCTKDSSERLRKGEYVMVEWMYVDINSERDSRRATTTNRHQPARFKGFMVI